MAPAPARRATPRANAVHRSGPREQALFEMQPFGVCCGRLRLTRLTPSQLATIFSHPFQEKRGLDLSAVRLGSHNLLRHGRSAAQPLAQADASRHRDGDPTSRDSNSDLFRPCALSGHTRMVRRALSPPPSPSSFTTTFLRGSSSFHSRGAPSRSGRIGQPPRGVRRPRAPASRYAKR